MESSTGELDSVDHKCNLVDPLSQEGSMLRHLKIEELRYDAILSS